jgi:hypothetical protein
MSIGSLFKAPLYGYDIVRNFYNVSDDPILIAASISDALAIVARLAWAVKEQLDFININNPNVRILKETYEMITVLEALNGIGPPVKGDAFTAGASGFAGVYASAGSAFPDKRWQGKAAIAYAAQNQDQQERVETIADADRIMAGVLNRQALEVSTARVVLASMKLVCVCAFWAAQSRPPPESLPFQNTVANVVLTGASTACIALTAFGLENAGKVHKAIAIYNKIAAGGVSMGAGGAAAGVSAAPASSVSGFSGSSGMRSVTPDVSGLAGVAGGDKRAPRSDFSGVGQARGADVSVESTPQPHTADAAAPSAPGLTMPTVAPLAGMSGQAAPSGQGQQVASMGQQGRGAVAPGEEAAEQAPAAGEVEGPEAGAASGAAGAQGVPIQVATPGGEQVQQPR